MDGFEIAFIIKLTHSPRNGSKVWKHLRKLVSNYTILLMRLQEISQNLITLSAIKIICIDHCKRSINQVFSSEDGMYCSPRFFSRRWADEAFWKFMHILEGIANLHFLLNPWTDSAFEFCFKVFSDYENDLFKSSFFRIKNGVFHQGMLPCSKGIKLFQASIAASHSCGEDYES